MSLWFGYYGKERLQDGRSWLCSVVKRNALRIEAPAGCIFQNTQTIGPTNRPPLPPRNNPGTLAGFIPVPWSGREDLVNETPQWPHGTRDLPACSAVPQPVPLCTHVKKHANLYIDPALWR
jgi:hypothetical protein